MINEMQVQQNCSAHLTPKPLPSFSIVYETENLSSVDLSNIYRSLASISQQSISPLEANEFLIIAGDSAPDKVIQELAAEYPWVTVNRISGLGYYEAKMLGAQLVTGDITVFCDSDCEYVSDWLEKILGLFGEKPEVNVVAGETSIPVRNVFEMAVAIHYFFPRFSQGKQPYIANQYFLNSVAFRRSFLLSNPIPINLPTYRSNCFLHTYYICKLKGFSIWKHPDARSIHEPPTPHFIFWRYLLRGRDKTLRKPLQQYLDQSQNIIEFSCPHEYIQFTNAEKIKGIFESFQYFKFSKLKKNLKFKFIRIQSLLEEDKTRFWMLPIALFITLGFDFLYTFGQIITYFKPNLLLDYYGKVEGKTENK